MDNLDSISRAHRPFNNFFLTLMKDLIIKNNLKTDDEIIISYHLYKDNFTISSSDELIDNETTIDGTFTIGEYRERTISVNIRLKGYCMTTKYIQNSKRLGILLDML